MYPLQFREIDSKSTFRFTIPKLENFEPARFILLRRPTRRYDYTPWRGEILVVRFSTDLQVAPKGTGRTG